MSVEQFELIMCDMYKMDMWMPDPRFEKQEFAQASYSQWVMEEFKNYLARRLYPRTEGTIDEFVKMAEEFIGKMDRFSQINSTNKVLFLTARNTVADIQDMLRAMK